ncbi:hypothetical protein HUU05_13150 [candidate division KSB1 bacterium]|nr:hypothetical protein [candidate division KSB1 bacterium]
MKVVKMFYDQEGDILEVRFAAGKEGKRTGIGLNEDVTLFCDCDYSEIQGLTILAYSKLVALPPQSLSELEEAPCEVKEKVRKLLQGERLQPFLSLENDGLRLHDVRVTQLASA